jgi:hypothetical protein
MPRWWNKPPPPPAPLQEQAARLAEAVKVFRLA